MRLEIGLHRSKHGTYLVRHYLVDAADFALPDVEPSDVEPPDVQSRGDHPREQARVEPGTSGGLTRTAELVRLEWAITVDACRDAADEELVRVPIAWADAERLGF
jgi:hypothetical protein